MLFCFFDKSGYRMSMQVIGLDGSMISLEALGDVFCRHVAYFNRCIMLHCELYWTLIEKPEPQVGWKRNGSAGKAHRSTSALIDPSVPTSSGISRRNADVFPGVGHKCELLEVAKCFGRTLRKLAWHWKSRTGGNAELFGMCRKYIIYYILYIYVNRKDHMQRVPLSQRHGSQYNSAKQIIMFDFSFDDFWWVLLQESFVAGVERSLNLCCQTSGLCPLRHLTFEVI